MDRSHFCRKTNDLVDQFVSYTTNVTNVGTNLQEVLSKLKISRKGVDHYCSIMTNHIVTESREALLKDLAKNKLDEKLALLEALEDKYKGQEGKSAWRPPRDPVEHTRNLRIRAKESTLNGLKTLISIREKEMADALAVINSARTELNSIKKRVNAGHHKVSQMEQCLVKGNPIYDESIILNEAILSHSGN